MKFAAIIRDNEELPHVIRICPTREDAELAIQDCINRMTNPEVGGPFWTWIEEIS